MGDEKIKELVDAGELEYHPPQAAKKDERQKPPIPVVRLGKPVDLENVIRDSKS